MRAGDEKNTTGDIVARVFFAVTRGRKSVSTTDPQPEAPRPTKKP